MTKTYHVKYSYINSNDEPILASYLCIADSEHQAIKKLSLHLKNEVYTPTKYEIIELMYTEKAD